MNQIFVRVFSENQWFGAWAPVEAMPSDKDEIVFILTNNHLTADDEYEFFEQGMEVRVEKFTDEYGNEFLGAVENIHADSQHNSMVS